MGGVWFPPSNHQLAVLWQAPFSTEICHQLVSADNPTGMITNSDLELLGAIAHQAVLAATMSIAESTNALLNDNTATIHWLCWGSVTSSKAAAYLLHLHALHSCHHRYITTYDYIPGPANTMADNCSHLWHLSDDALLTHFNSCYLQAAGWTLCQLPSVMHSALISVLQRQQQELELYLPVLSLPANQHWALWTIFCHNIQVDPYLSNLDIEPIHLLWVFAICYCNGSIAPHG